MTNPQKSIINLPSRKALIYCLLIAISTLTTVIGVLWYKLENYEDRHSGTSSERIKQLELDISDLKKRNDSLSEANTQIREDCSEELKAKDQETIKDLKERLALQQRVNEKVSKTEKNVDAVVKQTENKITRLTYEIKEKHN